MVKNWKLNSKRQRPLSLLHPFYLLGFLVFCSNKSFQFISFVDASSSTASNNDDGDDATVKEEVTMEQKVEEKNDETIHKDSEEDDKIKILKDDSEEESSPTNDDDGVDEDYCSNTHGVCRSNALSEEEEEDWDEEEYLHHSDDYDYGYNHDAYIYDECPGEDDEECLIEMEEWVFKEGFLTHISDWLQCESLTDEAHCVIHESWDIFRDTYKEVMIGQNYQTDTFQQESGYQVPVTVKYTEGIGRGVFANEDIQRGTLVWRSVNTARFDSGDLYREYLRKLPTSHACDILQWAYTRKRRSIEEEGESGSSGDDDGSGGRNVWKNKAWNNDGEYSICVDLDEGSFTNACLYDVNNKGESECNIGFKDDVEKDKINDCKIEFYSTRDISKGEELLLIYDDFNVWGWNAMNLQYD